MRNTEGVSLTEVGKMIFEEGKEEGIMKGKSELLVKLLTKKFKGLPKDIIEAIEKLPDATLEVIAMDIFTIESIDELREYIK